LPKSGYQASTGRPDGRCGRHQWPTSSGSARHLAVVRRSWALRSGRGGLNGATTPLPSPLLTHFARSAPARLASQQPWQRSCHRELHRACMSSPLHRSSLHLANSYALSSSTFSSSPHSEPSSGEATLPAPLPRRPHRSAAALVLVMARLLRRPSPLSLAQ
jgi:hypothetical protein